MPEITFNEKILEEFEIFYESMASGVIGNDYKAFKKFISQALDKQRKEFMKCIPDEKEETFLDDNIFEFPYNCCRDELLDNLKKAKLI